MLLLSNNNINIDKAKNFMTWQSKLLLPRLLKNVFNKDMAAQMLLFKEEAADPNLSTNPALKAKCVTWVKARLLEHLSTYAKLDVAGLRKIDGYLSVCIEKILLNVEGSLDFSAVLNAAPATKGDARKLLLDAYGNAFLTNELLGRKVRLLEDLEEIANLPQFAAVMPRLEERIQAEEAVGKHIEARTSAKQSSFKQSRDKPSGVSEGYVGIHKLDIDVEKQEYMFKFARKTNEPFEDPKKPGTMINRNAKFDTMDYLCEFMMAPLYERMLYNRSPVIAPVKSNSPDVTTSMRSKFLPGAKSIADYTDSTTPYEWGVLAKYRLAADRVEGIEKLWAAYLSGGDEDIHLGNAVIMDEPTGQVHADGRPFVKSVFGKIDMGKSGAVMFTDGEKMWKNFSNRYRLYEYDKNVNFDVSKFSTALSENAKISADEISRIVKSRIHILKQLGFDPNGLEIRYWVDDEFPNWDNRNMFKTKTLTSFRDLEEFFIDRFTKHWKAQAEFQKLVVAVEKMSLPGGTTAEQWKKGAWINLIENTNPVLYAVANNLTIDGLDPYKYAMLHDIKIDGKPAAAYLDEHNLELDGRNPYAFAVLHNLQIDGKPAYIYVSENSLSDLAVILPSTTHVDQFLNEPTVKFVFKDSKDIIATPVQSESDDMPPLVDAEPFPGKKSTSHAQKVTRSKPGSDDMPPLASH